MPREYPSAEFRPYVEPSPDELTELLKEYTLQLHESIDQCQASISRMAFVRGLTAIVTILAAGVFASVLSQLGVSVPTYVAGTCVVAAFFCVALSSSYELYSTKLLRKKISRSYNSLREVTRAASDIVEYGIPRKNLKLKLHLLLTNAEQALEEAKSLPRIGSFVSWESRYSEQGTSKVDFRS
jgi:hypothetical protein